MVLTLSETLAQAEKGALIYALIVNNWAIGKTAKALNISRKSLWEKMKRHKITKQNYPPYSQGAPDGQA